MTALSRRQKANAIRALSMDAVQRAGSGHPGAPMGMADLAEALWCGFLKHNPGNPQWCDRDRFVLSNGHASMLLYALLHLCGYEVTLDDLRAFRQLHSKTPGHPEFGVTPGVETTTGPLGQGLANAAGMALAERALGAQFNRGEHCIVDHFTYVFAGDGCLMEGISHEACSLAGTLGLGKLIVFYDDNGISIDGEVRNWFADDTASRFAAYGWHVEREVDGHDAGAISRAICAAREDARPSLLCCRTVIGYGSPNQSGKASSHGAPLGEEEIALAREKLQWPHAPFEIPRDIYAAWDARAAGEKAESEWNARFAAYQKAHPQLAAEFLRRVSGELPREWKAHAHKVRVQTAQAEMKIASRKASQVALENFAPVVPELIGGSADLTESNLTTWPGARAAHAQDDGACVYFGVREFAMTAMVNGIVLHRGFKPFGATFLIFSDYARNALRLAALMQAPGIFVFTHDSVGLGEDGPTHQPVEQLASLRLLPGMSVWRPCDAVETSVAWQLAIESRARPFALALSRQALAHQPRDDAQLANIEKGGYVLRDCDGAPEIIFIATGSEVDIAMQAAAILQERRVRVVSMPSVDHFEMQSGAYRESVLPRAVELRVVIEAGVTAGWERYAGARGAIIGIDRFGESAPGAQVFEHFQLTPQHAADVARKLG